MKIIRFTSTYREPYPLQVVGEQSYRDEIEEVVGFVDDEEGVNDDSFFAQLVLDDKNIHNRNNAVAVEINGKTVGYLSKPDAREYRARLKELGLGDVVGECHASIRGGFTKGDGTVADFGIRLDLDLATFKPHVPAAPKPKPTAPTVTQPPPVRTERAVVTKILNWFFAPSKTRWLRVILFIILLYSLASLCNGTTSNALSP